MALVTTFATTPLTSLLFPPWYQRKLAAWKRGEIDWDGNRLDRSAPDDTSAPEKPSSEIRRLLICLRLDSLPSLFTFVDLLGGERSKAVNSRVHPALYDGKSPMEETSTTLIPQRPVEVHGLRLLELTERLSSVMKESEADELTTRDPVVNAFHTFGQLHNVAVSGDVQLVPEGAYADVLGERASDRRSDLILMPWSESGSISETVSMGLEAEKSSPFGNASYNHFVNKLFRYAPCSTAIFINKGFGAVKREENVRSLRHKSTMMSLHSVAEHQATAPIVDRSHHIFLPFVGGDDDRVALMFVLRLAQSANVTATVSLVQAAEGDRGFFDTMRDNLAAEISPRVVFDEISTGQSLTESILEKTHSQVGLRPKNAGDLVVIGRHLQSDNLKSPTQESFSTGLVETLGQTAEVLINAGVKASLLVVQAGKSS